MNTTLDQNGPDAGLAWGFLEATATTPRWHGLGVGATGLGVVNLWSDEPGDFEQMFTVPTDLRELYLDFDSGTSELSATLGRRAFPANPVLDGDSQQGLGLSLPLNNGATVHVAAQIADLPIGPPRQGIAVHRLAARGHGRGRLDLGPIAGARQAALGQ